MSHTKGRLKISDTFSLLPLEPPGADGKWYFENPFSKVRYGISNEKVAACVEFVYGLAFVFPEKMGKFANEYKTCVEYIIEHDAKAYHALID